MSKREVIIIKPGDYVISKWTVFFGQLFGSIGIFEGMRLKLLMKKGDVYSSQVDWKK